MKSDTKNLHENKTTLLSEDDLKMVPFMYCPSTGAIYGTYGGNIKDVCVEKKDGVTYFYIKEYAPYNRSVYPF